MTMRFGFLFLLTISTLFFYSCKKKSTSPDLGPSNEFVVMSSIPENDIDSVPTDVIITIEFSSSIDPESITKKNFTVVDSFVTGNGYILPRIFGEYTINGNIVSFKPFENLASNKLYHIIIDTTISNESGFYLNSEFHSHFRTRIDSPLTDFPPPPGG